MLKISYIKLFKTLYLKAPNESHSCILLFSVLYNIAPLYLYLVTPYPGIPMIHLGHGMT